MRVVAAAFVLLVSVVIALLLPGTVFNNAPTFAAMSVAPFVQAQDVHESVGLAQHAYRVAAE